MADFTKQELEAFLQSAEEHLAETKLLGPGYYKVRERYDYAIDADERYIEKLKRQIVEYDRDTLNKNQQIVLEWLKSDDHPSYSNIFDIFSDLLDYQVPVEVGEAFTEMMTDSAQQFQVLQAFAEWGMEQEAER